MPTLVAIDDEREFTSLIDGYFGARGFRVLIANDGASGLQLVWAESPEICLIDLKMPGLHGDEVLKEIRSKSPRTHCIMITASEGEGKTREKLLSLGAAACFDKPLTSLRHLEAKIKEVLGA